MFNTDLVAWAKFAKTNSVICAEAEPGLRFLPGKSTIKPRGAVAQDRLLPWQHMSDDNSLSNSLAHRSGSC